MQSLCQIRPAKPEDILYLRLLSCQLGYQCTDEEFARRWAICAKELIQEVLVADTSDSVVGMVHVVRAPTLEADPKAEIRAVVVDENHRGKGIGEALIRAAFAWAKDQGLAAVRLRMNVVREDAHRFYLRIGFEEKKQQVIFEKQI